MRPSLEELEERDCPSRLFAPSSTPDVVSVPWWGSSITQMRVPVSPPGMLPVELMDRWDQFVVVTLWAPVHPTYMQPLPPWFAGVQTAPPGAQWQGDVNDYSPGPVPALWVNIPDQQWLAFQHAIYYPDPSQVPAVWQTELAAFQQTIEADDQALIAARDAYWASQPTTAQPAPTIADPLLPSGDALIVQALLNKEKN